MAGEPVFARLVAPHAPADFLATHWDKRAALTGGGAGPGRPLIAFDLLALKQAALRAPPGTLSASYNEGGRVISTPIGADQLDFCHGAGMTINLREAHVHDAGLAELVTTLRRELRYGGNVEAYVFWSPEGAGLATHFDDSGAFVIPVAGAKAWRYGATPALPFPPAPVQAVDAADMQLLYPWCRVEAPGADDLCETVLRPGDALYLPAGTWHTASAIEPGGTLAVTVSFAPRPLHRSVARMLEGRLMPRAPWRQTPVPGGVDPAASRAARADRLRSAFDELRALVEAMSFEDFAAACGHDGGDPSIDAGAAEASDDDPSPGVPLAEDDWLSPVDLVRFAPGEDDDGEPCFVVTVGGESVTVGLEALAFLDELSRVKVPFRAGRAASWVGGAQDGAWDRARPVLEGLLARGLLSKADPPAPG